MSQPSTLHVSSHPAILHKLAILRSERTEPKKFREVVRELSWLLGYEALADVRVRPLTIRTPIEEMEAAQLFEAARTEDARQRQALRLGGRLAQRLVTGVWADEVNLRMQRWAGEYDARLGEAS